MKHTRFYASAAGLTLTNPMTIMAFALNLDPAYVGAHQMARYIGLALLMPAATSYVLRRMGAEAHLRLQPMPSKREDR